MQNETTTIDTTAPGLLGSATYCPESDKLRLYVGRVARPIYDRLRAEGWQATPKQECDFAAVWTPQRRDTAQELCGEIEDEDTPPAERAAQRAERFAGYRDKRADEAKTLANRFDAAPRVFGFQDAARGERAAARVDRIAGRAVDQWSKAEYWHARTRGVIANALHKAAPSVRMGRIKELEADERRLSGATLTIGLDWLTHVRLRLEYERMMLEADGGRAGELEIVPGGWVIGSRTYHRCHGWRQIEKVNRSNVTGRVTSVTVKMPGDRWGNSGEGWHLAQIDIERASPETYRAPTPEELAAFEASRVEEKKAAKEKAPAAPSLINPTDEDAERLQAVWNEENAGWIRRTGEATPTVLRMSQEQYSAISKGAYARGETVEIIGGGRQARPSRGCGFVEFPAVAKVRKCGFRAVVIHDKPRKALTPEQWTDPVPALRDELAGKVPALLAALRGDGVGGFNRLPRDGTEGAKLVSDARRCGLAFVDSLCQFGLTEKGKEWVKSLDDQGVDVTPAPLTPSLSATV